MAFRRWYHGRGGGGPPFFNPDKDVLPPINPPRTQLLDRYDQHTKHCTSCKKVLSHFATTGYKRKVYKLWHVEECYMLQDRLHPCIVHSTDYIA